MLKITKERRNLKMNLKYIRQKAAAVCFFPMLTILLLICVLPVMAKEDARMVKVAFFPMDGYHNIEKDGSCGGMDVEYLNAICEHADWKIKYVKCDSWEAALRMLEKKEVDLVGSAQYSQERAEQFLYADMSSGYTFGSVVVKADSPLAYEDFIAMKDISYGMVEGYVRKPEFMQYLKDNGIEHPHILEYAHTEQMQEALESGKIDAYVHTFTEIKEGQRLIGRFAPKPFYYITYQGNDGVMRELNQAISELKLEQPALETELMNEFYYSRLEEHILLTVEEKEYVETVNNITVGYLDGYYPFSYEEDGEFTGIARDMLDDKVASLGLTMSYVKLENQSAAIQAVQEGQIDVLAYCVDSDVVKEGRNLNVIKEYAHIPVVLVTKGMVPLDQVRKLATVSYLEEEADKVIDMQSILLFQYPTQRESVRAVQNGSVQAALCDGYLVEHLLRTESIYNELQVQNVLSGEHSVYMIASDQVDEKLISVFEKSLTMVDIKQVSQYTLKENAYSLLSIRQFVRNHSVMLLSVLVVILSVIVFVAVHMILDGKKIQKLMYMDADTNVWNLNYLVFHGEHKLLVEHKIPYAVVVLSVAQLRQYNMIYGWNAGVKVLEMVADTFKKNLDAQKEVYAINQGEKFVLLLAADEEERFIDRLVYLKKEIEKCIRSHTENRMTVQCGVYMLPQENVDLYLAATYAGQALDFVNDSDIADIKVYDETLAGRVKERHARERLLETVDINKDFVAYYQPKVDIRNDQIVGAEALVRFKDPTADGAIRAPGFFIPYFEQTGRVLEIDFFVLESACKMLRRRLDEGKPVVTISCNFSRMHFMKSGFPEQFEAVLDKYRIPKHLIEVEITETLIMEEMQQKRVKKTLDILNGKGIRLSIDDFGAGYSSLGVFEQIPASVIKLDRSFLLNQEDRERQVKIMRGIVQLSTELNVQIVCEGVETKEDICLMQEIGAHVAQGYFYSKPVPEEEFEAQLI